MEPILTTVALALASKFTVTYITETVLGGWLGNRADSIITDKIPSLSKRILAQFKDTEIPVNNHLQKAVLSSHWLATKVFAEQLKKTNGSPVFKRIIHIADEQLNLLTKEDYQLEALNSETYETDLFIFKNEDNNLRTLLREKAIDNHLLILFDLLRTYKKDNPEWIVFQNALTNGLISKNLDWLELACSFLNELMKGDDNKAKDTFQNQELAKLAFGVAGLKEELILGFETLANQYVQSIGEDQFNEYVDWLCEDLKEIKGSLNRIEITTTETNTIVKRIEAGIIELQGLQKKELNLNNFPDYKNFLTDIENLNIAFDDKRIEVQETLEFLEEENNERKRDRFTKDLNRLEQELLELDNTRVNKQNEFEEFKRDIEKTWLNLYADDIPNSPRLVKARKLFEAGNLQAANAALDPQLLQQDYDLLKKAKDFIQQKEAILAQEYLTKANFTVLSKTNENWFTEAKEYYRKAVELHKNYDNCFAYALFLQEHKQIIEAIEWYEKTLSFIQNKIGKATTLNNLGLLRSDQNDFKNALRSYKEALDIYRELARESPQTYLPYVATTLNNLGNLQSLQNDFEDASQSYQAALGIRRGLAISNPQMYLPDVATTLNNLGNLQSLQNDFEDASQSYQVALGIRRELAGGNPQMYLPDVAATLNNLGNLQSNQNDFGKALESYQEALSIRRELVRVNPQTYLPDVARTLNNLGNLQSDKNDFENASQNYLDALYIIRELARVNPQTYLPDVAVTLNNLGNLHSVQNDFENAFQYYQETLAIRRGLVRINPQTYLPEVATTLNNLGNLHSVQNDYKNASQCYQEALDIIRALTRVEPQTYLPDVATTLNNLGNLQRANNNFENALLSYQEALDIRRELTRVNPNAFQIDLAETLISFAIFHLYNVKDKKKSLDFAYHAFGNAQPYHQNVPRALHVCQMAIQVWGEWGENLEMYLEDNNE